MGKPFFWRDRKHSMIALPYCINKLLELGIIKGFQSSEWVKKGHPLYGFDRKFKVDGFITFVDNPQLSDWIPVAVRVDFVKSGGVKVKDGEIQVIKNSKKTGYKYIAPQMFIIHKNTRENYGPPSYIYLVDSQDIDKAYDVMQSDSFLTNNYRKEDAYKDGRHYNHFSLGFIEAVTGKKVQRWTEYLEV
jgi:hypothetical protein